MDGGFRFEIGVFSGTFIPTAGNVASWAASWRSARRVSYNANTRRFSDNFSVSNNAAPFTIGKSAYVWGFRGDALVGEWILFRAAAWTWPDANSFVPSIRQWEVASATAIVGSINSSGSPFLMKSASVTNAAPPATSWSQWQGENLVGVSLNGAGDDPDHDGVSNFLEFVFGTQPFTAGPPPSTSLEIVESGGQNFLQMRLARRVDHTADITAEVSSDLQLWQSGATRTAVVESSLAVLVIRELTPIDPFNPRRFMRLRATLP